MECKGSCNRVLGSEYVGFDLGGVAVRNRQRDWGIRRCDVQSRLSSALIETVEYRKELIFHDGTGITRTGTRVHRPE